ncbi:tryptophan synthase subunit beta [Myxococcota bacterium]|nr:tryptophan synthase subunit beta [Myxococcota bacterium]MBU1381399.1 tryptophan synthase subunit beta [Myxococcota bacterium]MBU1498415.1 tryptophan synthase subunit beta [Myxococcota bacterium]
MKKLINAGKGFFGEFGGCFLPDELVMLMEDLSYEFGKASEDEDFIRELDYYFKNYAGRPSPLYFAQNLTEKAGGAAIFLKREDLNHLGAHKINNALGQVLLAKKMGKRKIVAETGAGQHGVAVSAVSALMGMECIIFMGEIDRKRQELNVFRMESMGAKVVSACSGQKTLKEAVDEAIGYYIENCNDTYYLLGSAVGPHPYPSMVKFFQSVIGREAKQQILKQRGRLPEHITACVGGGSNALGLFAEFLENESVQITAVEPSGRGLTPGNHAATLTLGSAGFIHGYKCLLLQDDKGDISDVYSISPGLDYPGVSPELSELTRIGRINVTTASDDDAVRAFRLLSKTEGIIPALESSHAIYAGMKIASQMKKTESIIINLSGRGDKDVQTVMNYSETA